MKLELKNLIASLGLTVAEAQREMETNAIGNFLSYFDTDSTGVDAKNDSHSVLEAMMIQIHLPCGNGEKTVSVPVAALALHNSLDLEEVIFKMNIRPTVEASNTVCCDVSAPDTEDESDGDNRSSMELVFKRNAPSEGIARLYTEFCKII